MKWDKDRKRQLKALKDEGLSAAEIGTRMKCSRNAVLGALHRFGMAEGRDAWRKRKAEKVPTRKPRNPRKVNPRASKKRRASSAKPGPTGELVIPLHERRSILTLTEETCRWPIGEVGDPDFHFCGRYCEPGVTYCEFHAGIAYDRSPTGSKRNRTNYSPHQPRAKT